MDLVPSITTKPLEYHNHTLSPADVSAARSCLLRFFPLELADIIMDDAMYWPRVKCTAELADITQPLVVTQDSGPICFLLTPKLSTLIEPGLEEGEIWRVRRVHFKMVSHDQGWCYQGEFVDPYKGSWTWFDAAIVREVDEGDQVHGLETDVQRCAPHLAFERGGDFAVGTQVSSADVVREYKGHSVSSLVQRNVRASRNYRQHEVIWSLEEDSEELNGGPTWLVSAKGSGSGHGFVDELKQDDKIAVVARALLPEWQNFVRKVEVDIVYSI